jgi:hypothetical protein
MVDDPDRASMVESLLISKSYGHKSLFRYGRLLRDQH